MQSRLDRFQRFRRPGKGSSSPPASDVEPMRPITVPALAIPPDPSSLTKNNHQNSMPADEKPTMLCQLKARVAAKRSRSPAPAVTARRPAEPRSLLARFGTPGSPPPSKLNNSAPLPSPASALVPSMPAFLGISPQDIELKFKDLVWRERTRLQSQLSDNPPSVWSRCPPPSYSESLDRYSNIHPWDNNRIHLRVPPGKVDYINASPIELRSPSTPTRVDRYIAMQGPTEPSWPHVWRMVTEQLDSPAVVVMLTETHEPPGYEKCYQYFPPFPGSEPMMVGDEFGDGFRASVRCESIENYSDCAIEMRKIIVKMEEPIENGAVGHPEFEPESDCPDAYTDTDAGVDAEGSGGVPCNLEQVSTTGSPPRNRQSAASPGPPPASSPLPDIDIQPSSSGGHQSFATRPKVGEERVVYHFLYKKWPDFGVPEVSDLESFFTLMRLSREYNGHEDNPRIVHCSAGVGRSGTFISLEHLMRELEAGYLERYDDNWNAIKARAPASSRSSVADFSGTESSSSLSVPGSGGAPLNDKVDVAPDGVCSELDSIDAVSRHPPRNGNPPDLILETVDALRRQRKMMVQAPSQYFFLYEVLKKLWIDKYERVDGEPAPKRQEVDGYLGQ